MSLDGEAIANLDAKTALFHSKVKSSGNLHVKLPTVHVEIFYKVQEGSFTIKMPSTLYSDNVAGLCGTYSYFDF